MNTITKARIKTMNTTASEMNPSRFLYLDYARSIALFLVVFAHLYSVDSEVKLYIYAFHMPFFFLVSGFLHKDDNLKHLVTKLSKKLLIPFCVFLFIGYLFYAIASQSIALGVILDSIKGVIVGKSIVANDILWFLLVLFQVRILGCLTIRRPFPILFLFGVLFVIFNYFQLNILYIGTTLMALPFYLYGHYAKEFTRRIAKSKWAFLLSICFLLMTGVISHYNGKVSMMGVNYGKYDVVILRILFFYINGIVGSYMLMCSVGGVKREKRWFLLPSRCAISIVGLQVIPIVIWYRTIGFNQDYLLSLAYTILMLILCVLFHLIMEKRANWIFGGK